MKPPRKRAAPSANETDPVFRARREVLVKIASRALGMTPTDVAQMFGMSRFGVYKLLARETVTDAEVAAAMEAS